MTSSLAAVILVLAAAILVAEQSTAVAAFGSEQVRVEDDLIFFHVSNPKRIS